MNRRSRRLVAKHSKDQPIDLFENDPVLMPKPRPDRPRAPAVSAFDLNEDQPLLSSFLMDPPMENPLANGVPKTDAPKVSDLESGGLGLEPPQPSPQRWQMPPPKEMPPGFQWPRELTDIYRMPAEHRKYFLDHCDMMWANSPYTHVTKYHPVMFYFRNETSYKLQSIYTAILILYATIVFALQVLFVTVPQCNDWTPNQKYAPLISVGAIAAFLVVYLISCCAGFGGDTRTLSPNLVSCFAVVINYAAFFVHDSLITCIRGREELLNVPGFTL